MRAIVGEVSLTASSRAASRAIALPREQVAHQVAPGPAVGAVDVGAELVVVEGRERLERGPGIPFLLEELERIEVHAAMVSGTAGHDEQATRDG